MVFLIVIGLIAILVGGVGFGIGRYLYFKFRYRTVASNEAMVVTGKEIGDPNKDKSIFKDEETGRHMKIVRGGGHLLRFKQTATKINLNSFQLQIETPKIITKDYVGIYGKAVATVKVADNKEGIVKYAEQFLGKGPNEIHTEIEEVLGSNLRAILSKMTVEDINGDRESFNEQVREIAQDQLDMMGFTITSLGLTDLWDDDNYLTNLGQPQVMKIQKTAELAEAETKQETELKKAEVNETIEKERLQREMSISESQKEKDIKDAQILAETQKEKAVAEVAYDLEHEERRIEVEKQRLAIREQEKENELKLRQMERENEVKLEEEQVKLEEQQVEVRKKQADAEYYVKTSEAEAKAAARIAEGEAEAEVIKKTSEAEVEAIAKRAEAMNKYQDVILREKFIEILPEYARAVSESLSNVESIRILDGGEGKQVNALPNTVINTMANLQEGLGQATGLDLENLLQNISGLGGDNKEKQVESTELDGVFDDKDLEVGPAKEEMRQNVNKGNDIEISDTDLP